MKKQFFKTTSIRVYSTAILTSVLLLTGFNPANATGKSKQLDNAQVSFVGSANNRMTFAMNYENTREEVFTVELTNDHGGVLYQGKFNEKNFSKNFVLRLEGEKCTINFTIKAGKNTFTQMFDLMPQVKTVQETVVTKL